MRIERERAGSRGHWAAATAAALAAAIAVAGGARSPAGVGARSAEGAASPRDTQAVLYEQVQSWTGMGSPARVDAAPDGGGLFLLAENGASVRRLATDGTHLGSMTTYGLSDIGAGPGGSLYAIRDLSIVRLDPTGGDMWSDRIVGEYHPQIGERPPFLAALSWDPSMSRMTLLFDKDVVQSFAYSAVGNRYNGPTLAFPSNVYWDLDYVGTRAYLVNRSRNLVEVYEGGAIASTVPLAVRAQRLAVGADNRLFVLVDRRWVYALDLAAGGAVIDAWDATDPTPGSTPSTATDLTVDVEGRVYVTDPSRDQVRVYAPRDGTRSGPTPGPNLPGCQMVPNKTADPTFLWLGQMTQVTLRLDGTCQEVAERADIVLVVDRSDSMNYEEGRKIAAARQSVLAFLDLMDLRRDQIGLVSFASEARIDVPLTQSAAAIAAAANALVAGDGTDIAEALDKTLEAFSGPTRRPDAKPIVVLMTDGVPFDTTALRAVNAGDRLRHAPIAMGPQLADHHVTVYTIGLGDDVNPDLLRVLATVPEMYFFAPTAADLADVYETVARRISASVLLKRLTIVDHVPSNMEYQLNSAVPPAVWDAGSRTLTWSFSDVPFDGLEMTYWLEPTQVGHWPTNVRADYDGTDGLGGPQSGPFPVPRVVVVAESPTPTATLPPTATPTASAPPTATWTPGGPTATPASPTATPDDSTPTRTATVPPTVPPSATTPAPPPSETTTATPTVGEGTPTPVGPSPTPDRYTIYVIIVFNGACFQRYTDVSLVIDASTTMLEPSENGRIKLDEAKDAARAFLAQLQLEPDRHGRHDQASIVWFNDTAGVEQPLTNDRAALLAAVDRIRPVEGSRIDLGIGLGHRQLDPATSPRRIAANNPALVLLSDGLPNRVPTPAPIGPQEQTIVEAADAAKRDGVTVFTVGYGRNVQSDFLRRVASQPDMYYFAPDGAALSHIYESIAGQLVCR
jgi:Mg-chelatase subunit ChlD